MSLSNYLKALGATPPKKDSPLWKGPLESGVTQSLLGGFLGCRERFRIKVVEGLRVNEGFCRRIEYGNMWHICEEVYHNCGDWVAALNKYCKQLADQYRGSSPEISKWRRICEMQFEKYLNYWSSYKEPRTSLLQEYEFDYTIRLGSGYEVRLRGKLDGVLQDKKGKLWLQENKTKGDVNQQLLSQQLTYDLQSMFYLCALEHMTTLRIKGITGRKIGGVLYNVVRRPVSGGKHTIVQKKGTKNTPPETIIEYVARIGERIDSDLEFFFMRWDVPVYPNDIKLFKNQSLYPILEQLCEWWDWITSANTIYYDCEQYPNKYHYRLPYGIHNPLMDGGSSYLDNYLLTGSKAGLHKLDRIFPELSED